jgi:hypothetical protein
MQRFGERRPIGRGCHVRRVHFGTIEIGDHGRAEGLGAGQNGTNIVSMGRAKTFIHEQKFGETIYVMKRRS